MDQSLLTEQSDPTTVDEDQALELLIGPGGKFYDPDREQAIKKMAKGKLEADLYITSQNLQLDEVKNDYSRLREEYNAGPKLQELIDKMTQTQLTDSESPDAREVETKPAYSAEELESIVSSQLSKMKVQEKEQENFKFVQAKLKGKFGDNYSQALKQHIEQLGVTEEYADDLAKKNPNLFVKAFELDAPRQQDNSFFSPVRSTQRNDSFSPASPKRTWMWYQRLKAEQPSVYNNPKTQVQLHKDRIALGDAFKDGDYDRI